MPSAHGSIQDVVLLRR